MTPVRPVPPPSPRGVAARAWHGPLAGLLLALLAIKLAGLLADPVLRFFMGDSGSYLHTALTGWRPPDRSYTYGLLVGATAIAAGSPWVLLGLQALFGVASALALAWLLASA